MDVLRASEGSVSQNDLDIKWPNMPQRKRAQDALVADGLVTSLGDGCFALPS
jgi:hypothetical protein